MMAGSTSPELQEVTLSNAHHLIDQLLRVIISLLLVRILMLKFHHSMITVNGIADVFMILYRGFWGDEAIGWCVTIFVYCLFTVYWRVITARCDGSHG